MKGLADFWKAESARIASVVIALAAAGLIPGSWGKAIGIVVPLIFGQAVRETVYSPTTVLAKVEDAAATALAEATPQTVGAAGNVTAEGEQIVQAVVAKVLG